MFILLRVILVVVCTFLGYLYAFKFPGGLITVTPYTGAITGFLIGLLVVSIDLYFKRVTVRHFLGVLLGVFFGLLLSRAVIWGISFLPIPPSTMRKMAFMLALVFSYLGAVLILRGQKEFSVMLPFVKLDSKSLSEQIILLDTSVIIDGRIADICETSFVSGKVIIPTFVLKELQFIADSHDDLKRARGRRGLEVLNRIKKIKHVDVKVHDTDFPEISAVDSKLVKLAQMLNAKIFTNDYNLNKIAELQGIPVLNINELANALKPVVLPGEMMSVRILREGKEESQGVAYLDDGTMIVVDGGKQFIGQVINVSVTTVLQTQAGRMIFAKAADEKRR
ncbi:MAG: TRAM domain-containing protein [Candidatus Omnitrophica bacterium]|nr:TRAM domain-containing protein [Candidatus Omnitrophota bacterium]